MKALALMMAGGGCTVAVLAGCSINPSLPDGMSPSGKYFCSYQESQIAYLIDLDAPDVVLWGDWSQESAAVDNKAVVERVAPRGKNGVATLVVRAYNSPNGRKTVDTFYTLFQADGSELRLRQEPSDYDPAEVGPDPFPTCTPRQEQH